MATASAQKILICDEPDMDLISPLCLNRDFHPVSRLRQNIRHLPPPAIFCIRICRRLTILERSVFILDSSKRSAVFAF
jgi:hypothetical protein